MAAWIKMPLGMEVGLGPGDFVLNGDPAPPQKFSAHVYCGQTAGWITITLRMELGLSPGDFVRWGASPLSAKRGRSTQNFRPMSTAAKRLLLLQKS